jgi:Peptidase inhibitor family I36
MRKIWGFTFVALVSLSLASPLSAAPQFGRQRDRGRGEGQVCIYKDIHYQGVEECFNSGDSIATLQSLNHQPSSIRITGRGSVTVYDDTNFRGHTTVFTSSVPDLGQVRLESKSWNDRIASLQVNSGYGSNGPYGNAPVYDGRQSNRYPNERYNEGICVYDRPNYVGRSQCWSGSESLGDLGRQGGWSDRISSIRVFGRTTAVVYRDTGFRGMSFVVDRDIPDLARISGPGFRNWDHQISSMQVENGRGYGRGRDRDRGYRDTDRDRPWWR